MENKMLKSCKTCFHRKGNGEFARCIHAGLYCNVERMFNTKCDRNYSAWEAKPPARSLKQWLYDIFWKI